jgi:hypothetical protein
MLIPRFSIRSLLLATVVVAIYCLCLTLAINGHLWALGFLAVLNAAIGLLVLHVLVFLVTLPIAWVWGSIQEQQQRPTSPFATHQPPPQLVPPQEPE